MRMILFVMMLATSSLTTSSFAQQPDQPTQLGNPVSKRDVLELPTREAFPEVTLQRALRIAERSIRKQKIDISSCYLFEGKLVSGESPEEASWQFWWVNVHGNKASTKDIRVTVTMHGKVQLR